MFAAYPGDVVFSKIDARNGAIGIVPSTIGKAVVTSEFPVFTANPAELHSGFAQRVLRSGEFLNDLKAKATGTSGRKRITSEAFLDLQVPLLPLPEQETIIAAYDAAFEAALGVAPAAPLPDRPVFIASFKDLDRWSHEGVLRRDAGEKDGTPAWPMVRLGDVIADLENGWSPQCLDRPAEQGEWGVLKLGAVSFGAYNETENKALPSHLKPRPSLDVKAGDVLMSRANVTRLVGATALVRETRPHLMLCDKIFRVVWQQSFPVTPDYIAEVLRINSVRRQIEAKLTGTSPTMKNISKPSLLSLTFPLPSVPEQQTLITALQVGRAEAARLRAKAERLRAAAWKAFKASVYVASA